MRRLRWVPLIVCLVLIVFLGSAVLYGRAMPAPAAPDLSEAGLDVCNGKLCLFHVTPGITTYDQAKHALASYITRDETNHFHGQVGGAEIRVETDGSGSETRAIQVQAPYNTQSSLSIRFSQIIQQFGMPCYIADVGIRSGGLSLVYPSFSIQVSADQERISLDSPISSIMLVEDNNLDAANRTCASAEGVVPWRGFASVQVYRSLQQNSQWSEPYGSYPR
jgi:hypothetical protein